MRALRWTGGLAAVAAGLFLSGCASVFGGYDLAPNGLPEADASIRRGMAAEPSSTHQAVVEGERSLPDDDLLRLLYAATTGRYAGQYLESSQYLDVAGYVAEDRLTESASRQALSFITNDRALPYTPSRTERLMIPYMAAVDFLQAGDLGGAVVEARRIEALLDRFQDQENDRAPDRRFYHHFAAVIFDAAGEANSADVAYRRAGVTPTAETPESFSDVPADSMGEVVVLVERGFVPHRVEQSVVIVLPPFQVELLTKGDAGEKAAAAAEAAARILLSAAVLYGDRGPYYTDHGYRQSVHLSPWQDRCGPGGSGSSCAASSGDFDPYLLRISWPVLYQDPVAAPPVRLMADGQAAATAQRLDVGAGVRDDFAAERSTMLARTVFRAATKMALSAGAEEAVSGRDKAAGRLVGLLVNLGTLLTERADTRSWHLLPGTVELVRVRLPAGTHALSIDADGWLSRDVDIGTVDVRAGRTSFVTHRIWR